MTTSGLDPAAAEAPAPTPRFPLPRTLALLDGLGATRLRRRLAGSVALSVPSALAQAGVLVLVTAVVAAGVHGNHTIGLHGLTLTKLQAILAGWGLLLVFLLGGLISAVVTARTGAGVLAQVRRRLIQGYFEASWDVQAAERQGNIQQLITQHSEQASVSALRSITLLQSLISATALIAVAVVLDPAAAGVVVGTGALLTLLLRPFGFLGLRATRRYAQADYRLATTATEYSRLARELRLFHVSDDARAVLETHNEAAARSCIRVGTVSLSGTVIYQGIALLILLSALAVVGPGSAGSLASTGAVVLLALRSISYGSALQGSAQFLRSQEAFLEGLRTQLDRYRRSVAPPTDAVVAGSSDLCAEGITYAYPGRTPTLFDLTFTVPAGSILGIVGPSGSGKTTLSQLILGLRQPQSGLVTLDGTPTSDLVASTLPSGLALVPQEPVLFEGTVADNIRFFRPATAAEVAEAARLAHIAGDIDRWPEGFDTVVGPGGTSLSVGQRQRLAIARALLVEPKLIVFDEPTSALDAASEEGVRSALAGLRRRVTTVVISHRATTVDLCDLLLVLRDGVICEFGPADEVRRSDAFQLAFPVAALPSP